MTRPPRFAEWLLQQMLDDSSREAVTGDLHEQFVVVSRRRGGFAAAWWYCVQAVGPSSPVASPASGGEMRTATTLTRYRRSPCATSCGRHCASFAISRSTPSRVRGHWRWPWVRPASASRSSSARSSIRCRTVTGANWCRFSPSPTAWRARCRRTFSKSCARAVRRSLSSRRFGRRVRRMPPRTAPRPSASASWTRGISRCSA